MNICWDIPTKKTWFSGILYLMLGPCCHLCWVPGHALVLALVIHRDVMKPATVEFVGLRMTLKWWRLGKWSLGVITDWENPFKNLMIRPICSMYGIFTYIWVIFTGNVGKYSIHGTGWHIWLSSQVYTRPGERLHSNGKSPFFMGKSTMSMAIFNCYLYAHQRVELKKRGIFETPQTYTHSLQILSVRWRWGPWGPSWSVLLIFSSPNLSQTPIFKYLHLAALLVFASVYTCIIYIYI